MKSREKLSAGFEHDSISIVKQGSDLKNFSGLVDL
jgi:hypothetical protein